MTARLLVARTRLARNVLGASFLMGSAFWKRCEQVTLVARVNIIGRISHRYECLARLDLHDFWAGISIRGRLILGEKNSEKRHRS
jgi:hypothetical protein